MEKLEFKKLEEQGKYKYMGFVITKEPKSELSDKLDEEGNTITLMTKGTNLLLFKSMENEQIFFVNSNDISDSTEEKPYGIFQEQISNFTFIFNVEFNENFNYIITV